MISDILFYAISDIRGYLENPLYTPSYTHVKDDLIKVIEEMDRIRTILDAPPMGREREREFINSQAL